MSIVCGYIDTPEGNAALDRAVVEARLRAERLVVLHSARGGSGQTSEEALANAEAIDAVEAKLKAEGVEYSTHDYVRGNTPAQDIMAAVRDHGGSMIVIGIRTRSATGKLLLGSNTLDILHDTTVPVLCVKAANS
ncbi:MAG TPA: universal stress protein [Acidimicrobiia bacterium]|nr:universal stress protein [Acidimicrobiia bacterium]